MRRSPFGPDAWLGLVPEVERLVPDLVTTMDGREAGSVVRERIEGIIRTGDADDWMRFVYDLADRCAVAGEADRAALTLAEILRDQYRLAPGVLHPNARDEEMSRFLEELTTQ